MALQTLAYNGYITVNHANLKKDVEKILDLNDDGKINREDQLLVAEKLMKVLQYNLPGGSGFVAGFVGGLRNG
jgi:uncharacterized membrane protein (Fun14 family)